MYLFPSYPLLSFPWFFCRGGQWIFLLFCLLSALIVQPINAEKIPSVTDNSGRSMPAGKAFTRIISLYSAHTENLCRLGAEQQIIGISQSDDYPLSILDRQRFSYREDPEKFIAARPDLIIIRPMIERSYPQFVKKLELAGIPVFSLQPGSVEELFDYWKTLGLLTGKARQADEMKASFLAGLKKVQNRLTDIPLDSRPKVYFESIHGKMKTFSQSGIAMYVLEQAGGINIAADARQVRQTNIAAYSKERILRHAHEIDVFLAQRGRMNPISLQDILEEPGFEAIKAVRENRVFLIEESLVSRPTYRILEGIEKLNSLFFDAGTD